MEKKKVFISVPMRGRTEVEIFRDYKRAKAKLEEKGFLVVGVPMLSPQTFRDLLKQDGVIKGSVFFLGLAIEDMSYANAVYFCRGWNKARGCCIEHKIAEEYGIEILYEEEGV